MHRNKVMCLLCLTFVLAGCAMRRYHAEPISSSESAAQLKARSLEDPQLRAFMERNLGHAVSPWPPSSWDLDLLTLAAFYFNPDLETARARVAASEAAVVTAGARPNPDIRIAPGGETSPESPWLFGLSFDLPIETAGKRGYRVERAQSLTDAARFELADAAWAVRSRVRAALADHLLSVRDLDLLRSRQQVLVERTTLLKARLQVGEIPRPELDAAEIELSNGRLGLSIAAGRVYETQAVLAAAVGVSSSALDAVQFSWPTLEELPSEQQVSQDVIDRDAVLNRLDVRRALAEYAAADTALKLEIAKQYPDLHIGPGYDFDEGHHKFSLGAGLTLPVFNHNQGPIAEAEARRKETGTQFLATQARVIGDSESALARYRAALAEFNEADASLTKLQSVREQMADQAVSMGEMDRLELNGLIFQSTVAAKSRLDALQHVQTALGALEDALQKPLERGSATLPLPQSSSRDRVQKEGTQ
jgi:cobalt-zinc-cadmium efflux system outer membrane protein